LGGGHHLHPDGPRLPRQLGHRNATYAMQYMRVSEEELDDVVNDRSG
jgi:hypothetical protein